jgi:hypothetical protein
MPRFHCEFKNCNCICYHSNKKKCLKCNHAKLWHSRSNKCPPTYNYLQFVTSRKKARSPIYVSDIHFAEIFIPILPTVPPLPDNFSSVFCSRLEELPA